MLSYRHGFHAGNHADVLKHLVQVLILDHLLVKPTAISYIDSHAGAGYYAFGDAFAAKNREFETGISRLRSANACDLTAPLQRYLNVIERCTIDLPAGYPGSPAIALQLLRPQDRAHLFELHPKDADALQRRYYRRARIEQRDGFAGIKSLLPPPSRRALVLIDPPYEIKTDYQKAIASLKDSVSRFENGVYALWYPLLNQNGSQTMAAQLKKQANENWLYCSLQIASSESAGMYGSAMYVINPPWQLADQLKEALPALANRLSNDPDAGWKLEYQSR